MGIHERIKPDATLAVDYNRLRFALAELERIYASLKVLPEGDYLRTTDARWHSGMAAAHLSGAIRELEGLV